MSRPLAFVRELVLPVPGPEDKRADLERLLDTLDLEPIVVPLRVLRALPDTVRQREYKINPVIGVTEDGYSLISVHTDSCVFGVAIDIGTTNMVASLWDLSRSRRLGHLGLTNPQSILGADLLSRIHHCMLHRDSLPHRLLIEGVNTLLERLTEASGLRPSQVHACCIATNTVMSHFLLDLDVAHIPVEPYVPVVHRPGVRLAEEIGLKINPSSVVYIFPNAGSYVGGDILSGIIATGIHRSEETSVLIDVGTNAEVVVGNRDWLLVGAGAAGPALEEGVLASGMRAEEGAIYRVDIGDDGVRFRTIGDSPPKGICGSGVVDLIAELYRTGRIDPFGRFTEKTEVVIRDGERFFQICGSRGGLIGVSEREIENFLRSKAALYTTLRVLLEGVGLNFSDIKTYYIAGALGSGVRVEKAQLLGMLPGVPSERFVAMGNTSLKGAEKVLQDSALLTEVKEVLSKVTYREMNAEPMFMNYFPSAIPIPPSATQSI